MHRSSYNRKSALEGNNPAYHLKHGLRICTCKLKVSIRPLVQYADSFMYLDTSTVNTTIWLQQGHFKIMLCSFQTHIEHRRSLITLQYASDTPCGMSPGHVRTLMEVSLAHFYLLLFVHSKKQEVFCLLFSLTNSLCLVNSRLFLIIFLSDSFVLLFFFFFLANFPIVKSMI